jgi:hypothetical protein
MLSRQALLSVTASEETTMRHALITNQLLHQARSTGPRVAERQLADAPPDPAPPADSGSRPHRLATLFRRARALVVRPT